MITIKRTPEGDQILAAMSEVERICGEANGLVTGVDPVVERLVQDAVRGAPLRGHESDRAAAVRYVPAVWRAYDSDGDEIERFANGFAPDRRELRHDVRAECARCWNPLVPVTFPETAGSLLLIPAGTAVVTMLVCPTCRANLDELVPGISWK